MMKRGRVLLLSLKQQYPYCIHIEQIKLLLYLIQTAVQQYCVCSCLMKLSFVYHFTNVFVCVIYKRHAFHTEYNYCYRSNSTCCTFCLSHDHIKIIQGTNTPKLLPDIIHINIRANKRPDYSRTHIGTVTCLLVVPDVTCLLVVLDVRHGFLQLLLSFAAVAIMCSATTYYRCPFSSFFFFFITRAG